MEEIYIKYSKLVYNYLYKLTNNIEISEELTQETFYSAIKGINKYRGESKLPVWLCQIAKNKWKDYIVKNKRNQTVPFYDNIESLILDEDLEEKICSKEQLINLYKKVHSLDINTREVIYLKMKGEFSFKEIGKMLGKSEEWARVTFYRGKLKLREELKNEE